MADNWFSDVMQGAGRGARQLGEGLFNAFAPERENANPTGMTPELFNQMQRGEQVTLPPRPGVVEQIINMTPLGAAKDVWRESEQVDQGGRSGAESLGNALFTLATMGVPGAKGLRGKGNALAAPIRGYHGSPHDFAAERMVRLPDGRTDYIVGTPDQLPVVPPQAEVVKDYPLGRFRADKIGTGEGNQSFSYGFYAAEQERLAKGYRDALSRRALENTTDPKTFAALQLDFHGGDRAKALTELEEVYGSANKHDPMVAQSIEWLRSGSPLGEIPKGKMYEVGIHADPAKFIDWDKPTAQQHPEVRRAIGGHYNTDEPIGAHLQRGLRNELFAGDLIGAPRATPQELSSTLAERGIPGVKYLDQGSRSAGQGSSNYVVFPSNAELIEILRKYGLLPVAGAAVGAAALPQQDERAM